MLFINIQHNSTTNYLCCQVKEADNYFYRGKIKKQKNRKTHRSNRFIIRYIDGTISRKFLEGL